MPVLTIRKKEIKMGNDSLVSVIIIFLNAEKFFEEAVESVFAQTYKNWELLLVDDGSTDGSTEIALRYSEQYPEKVHYLEHDGHLNRGMSASRNLGIEHAKGKYIAFLDADDVWLPQKLEQQIAILDSHPKVAMVYGRTLIWHSWNGHSENSKHDYMLNLGIKPDTLVEPPMLLPILLQGKFQSPTTCNAMIRREVFKDVGGFVDSFRGMSEDRVFFTKLGLKLPVFVSHNCWARYRQHPDSCCAVAEKTGDADSAWLSFLKWVEAYLTEQGINDAKVLKVLNKAFRHYGCQNSYGILGYIYNLRWRMQSGLIWTALGIAKWTLPASTYRWIQMKRGVIIQDTTRT